MSHAAAIDGAAPAPRLPGYALFAGMLAAAGLPVYIHAPKVYADEYGVSLAALGTVLFALRLIDVVQDPALGWLAARSARWRGAAVSVAAATIAGGMLPKVSGAVKALKAGIRKTHIIDSSLPHSLLLELFTEEGVGTEIVSGEDL